MIVKFTIGNGFEFSTDTENAEGLCTFLNIYRRERKRGNAMQIDPAIWPAIEKIYDSTNVNRRDKSTMWERHLVNIIDRMNENEGFDDNFFRNGGQAV